MTEHSRSGKPGQQAPGDSRTVPSGGSTGPQRTPMYRAMHTARYERQTLLNQLRTDYGKPLICYTCGLATLINRDDAVFLVDLLHNVPRNEDLDVMLHTVGGDIDAAEKLMHIVRTHVGPGRLRIIVPDFAKSAGTLMALGGDQIVMGDSSELGPIDPQVTLNDGRGNLIPHSVQSYLDAYKEHSETLRKDPQDASARIMLGKLDPATVKLFEVARTRALKIAEDQLRQGMFKAGGNFTMVARELIDTNKWLSHGQVISWQAATNIGLEVLHLDQQSLQWQAYWRLYCLQRLAIKDREKLFESEYASLCVDGGA